METETADSGIDMEAAQESLSADLFPQSEESNTDENTEMEDSIAEDKVPEEAQTKEPTEETTEATESQTLREPPSSWKKEMHDAFSKLDPAMQDYIEQREQQMHDGLEKDRNDANIGRAIRDIVTPYQPILDAQGVNTIDTLKFFMNAHAAFSNATPDQKMNVAKQFLQAYGISLDGEQQQVDPVIQQILTELNAVKGHLSATEAHSQQVARDRVMKDVEAFASEHSYFDEVAEDIVPFIHAGLSLEDAYNKAIWTHPVIRQKEIERLQTESQTAELERKKQEAEKAKKAKSVNVRTRDTKNAPTEPLGTMEDTMRETYREIQNR